MRATAEVHSGRVVPQGLGVMQQGVMQQGVIQGLMGGGDGGQQASEVRRCCDHQAG